MKRVIPWTAMGRALGWLLACGVAGLLVGSPGVSARQAPSPAPEAGLEILPVGGDPAVGKVYLFAGTGANVVVQAGEEGALLVDTSTGSVSERLIAEVRGLTTRPIRYVINTTGDADHIGGNDRIAAAGLNFATPVPNLAGVGARGGGGGGGGGGLRPSGAQIYAHEGVLAMKTHLPGNYAGVHVMRDIPQFVRLVEAGRFDAKSLVGETFPLDRARDALQVAADRTAITGIVTNT